MKKSKKIVALCLSFVLLFAAVGGTIAWLTDKDSKQNVFSVGKIDINLFEQVGVTDAQGNDVTEGKVTTTENGSTFTNLLPGNVITKAPTVYNNGGNDAYVRVVVTINNTLPINLAIDENYEGKGKTEEELQTIKDNIFNGWGLNHYHETDDYGRRMTMNQRDDAEVLHIDTAFLMSGGNYQYNRQNAFKNDAETNDQENDGNLDGALAEQGYYYSALEKDNRAYIFYLKLESQDTYTLFNGLTVPTDFDTAELAMFDGLEINIYADAIQTEGFATWQDAIKALNEQHPLADLVAGK